MHAWRVHYVHATRTMRVWREEGAKHPTQNTLQKFFNISKDFKFIIVYWC